VDRNTSTGAVTDASDAAVVRHIAGSVATDATGVRLTARSSASGFLMSPPIDFTDFSTCFRTGASAITGLSAASDGFTSTTPDTSAPCVSASRSARQPPIERPATNTCEHRCDSAAKARAASAYQSVEPVRASSCQVPPCPASSGARTVSPAAARCSAQPRTVWVLPVNPCRTRTPTGPPSADGDAATGYPWYASTELVAALARQVVNRAAAPVLGTLPSGWRNVVSAPQRVSYTAAGEQYHVAYRVLGDAVQASVNGVPLGQTLRHTASPDRVDLEIDGIRRVYRVHRVGPGTYVDASDGSSALTEVPRFGDPEKLAAAGSLLAPMPGLVRRVLVEVGAVVTAGQPLLVLEAMKMEQTVAAPAAGVVAELRAKAGEQVAAGQVLAVVETSTAETGG